MRVAIAVQRGNADIMIQDSVRRRGTSWPRRRRAARLPRRVAKPRSRVRTRRGTGTVTEDGLREPLDARAMARVARMIGLLDRGTTHTEHSLSDVDSDAETEPALCADMLSSMPSVIPETPLTVSVGSEAGNAAITLVQPPARAEEQGTGACPMELSGDAALDGGPGGRRVVVAVAVVSMAEIMDDVVDGTMPVNSVREMAQMGAVGSCSVKDCSVVVPAVRVT